jgi:hypothetical protein
VIHAELCGRLRNCLSDKGVNAECERSNSVGFVHENKMSSHLLLCCICLVFIKYRFRILARTSYLNFFP